LPPINKTDQITLGLSLWLDEKWGSRHVAYLRSAHEMSERRAIQVIGADRSAVRYRSTRPDDTALRDRLKSLELERRRFS
jgi:hypothetical protein